MTGCSAIERSATARHELKPFLQTGWYFDLGAQLNGQSRHQDCLRLSVFDKEIIAGKNFMAHLD